jgi:hypothetical protein
MVRIALLAALIALPTIVQAQAGDPPKRIRSVTITGEERCPPSTNDEVVVCRRAENPYRIPEELRDSGPIPKQNQAWANRVSDMREIDRRAGGVPNSCSPIGTAGQTGCSTQALNAWYAEKRAQQTEEGRTP